MRPSYVVILASTLMLSSSAPIPLKLDHVGICAYDLQSLQDAFASVGLRAEYRGRSRHRRHAQRVAGIR